MTGVDSLATARAGLKMHILKNQHPLDHCRGFRRLCKGQPPRPRMRRMGGVPSRLAPRIAARHHQLVNALAPGAMSLPP
jgi:hypothetical protein